MGQCLSGGDKPGSQAHQEKSGDSYNPDAKASTLAGGGANTTSVAELLPPQAQQASGAEVVSGIEDLLSASRQPGDVSFSEHLYTVCKRLQPGDKGIAESRLLRDVSSLEGARGLAHDIVQHGPPRPPNDEDRRDTLRSLGLEHADHHPELDKLCQVVTSIFGGKIAALALFSESRVWLAGAVGAPLGHAQWRISGCPWDLLVPNPTTMVCEDLTEDARFSHQPWTLAGLRTYVSSPLVASNGHRIGSICYMNDEKMRVDYGQCRLLNNIAELTVREVERFANLPEKMKTDDVTCRVFTNCHQEDMRNMTSAHESCLVLLDMSVAGWKVLYTNKAWQDWTGIPREACLGSTLCDVLQSALDGSPLPCDDHLDDVALGKRFILPKLQSRGGLRSRVFDLSFRSASLEALDDDTLPVDIPTFVPRSSSMEHIYFARMHTVNTSMLSGKTTTSYNPRKVSPVIAAPLVIFGLRLHQVIGCGGYATVYHACWQDNPVAAKVQDYHLENAKQREEAELEIVLGQRLKHGNVVNTLCHASVTMDRPLDTKRPASSGYDADEANDASVNLSLTSKDTYLVAAGAADPHAAELAGLTIVSPVAPDSDHHHTCTTSDQAHTTAGASTSPSASQHAPMVENSNGRRLTGSPSVSHRPSVDSSRPASVSLSSAGELGTVPPSHALAAARAVAPSGGRVGEAAMDYDSANAGLVGHAAAAATMLTRGDTQASTASLYPRELRTFQVLELCDKGCLQDAIDRGWLRTSPSQTAPPHELAVLATAVDVAKALDYLHQQGVVHGDLTPANVLLKTYGQTNRIKEQMIGGACYHYIKDDYGREFRAKVADFGKARTLGVQDYIRTSSYGTITHMAPEVLRSNELSRPADVYALGVLLWSMWTGSRPWAGLSHTQIMATVITNAHHLVFPEDTPEDIAALGARCLAPSPADRPPTSEVVAALQAGLALRNAPIDPLVKAISQTVALS